MALYQSLLSGAASGAKGIFSGLSSFAKFSPGAFMTTGGAIAGAASSIYQGDNYSSTALLRNAISGAVVGGGMGLAARGLFTKTAARAAGRFTGVTGGFRSSPLGKMMGFSAGTTRTAGAGLLSVGKLMARHPEVGFGGAIVAGGAYSMSSGFTTERELSSGFSTEGRDIEQMTGNRDFANSASGLVFGLSARRHR